jgi:hypothetical protein
MANLLHKASIITTPTAYGVGVLNSIKPAYALGEELVTNGNFATDSDWNKGVGWTISGGKANANTIGNFVNLYQNSVFVIGRKYKYSFTVANYTQGSIRFTQGGLDISGEKTSTGVYTGTFTASNYTSLYMQGKNSFIGSIDNISVKEITDADFDFTRTSSATRVNPDYLIEDVSILSSNLVQNGNFSELGSELVTNGNFATDSDWTKGTGWTISGGKASSDGSQTSNSLLYQSNVITSGSNFKCEVTISNYQSGILRAVLGGGGSEQSYSANGTYTFYGNKGSDNNLYLSANSDFIGSIDNVSVKQVDPNDNWTLKWG